MKILMCNLLLFTLILLLKSVQSMYRHLDQPWIVTFQHEYLLPEGTKIYSHKNRHYIRDVSNNNPQPLWHHDKLLRNDVPVAVAKEDKHGTHFYDLRTSTRAVPENDDTVLRSFVSLAAVYVHPIGFRALHELKAGSYPTAHLNYATDLMQPSPVQYKTVTVGYDYFLPVNKKAYSLDNRHYILEEGNNHPPTLVMGDQILRNKVPVAIAEERAGGTNFYDLDESKRAGNERTTFKEDDTVLRNSTLVAAYIVPVGFRALRELRPSSSLVVHHQ